MRLRTRRERLEQRIGDPGCPACRERQRSVLIKSQRLANGDIEPIDPVPQPCTTCGKMPEFIIEVLRPFVGPLVTEE